ncbi:hypothetical protein CDAR_231321 [Caerostris darwini]|uniref:Uncharacterized protein n=1 Tax=Caerostris darwini TaxID=1538125 RepID=A0AAV4WRN2_9ARAC|nr:hypothetical protein CDAR_231321 [Caerostris darwini]
MGSGDTLNKSLLKIISGGIQRFRRLKKSDSQYLRRLLALKFQVDSLPDESIEKVYVYNNLLNTVYAQNERIEILSSPRYKNFANKLKSLKISPAKSTSSHLTVDLRQSLKVKFDKHRKNKSNLFDECGST